MPSNKIGLSKENSKKLSDKLNELLSNYTVFYMNVRGYHWNIKGKSFFTLHEKFEELYDDLFLKIDEVAERILTLGNTPLHSYTDFLKHSKIKEDKNISTGEGCVQGILNAFKTIIQLQREVIQLADEIGDNGTDDMIGAYISEQEKIVWMYASYLNESV